MLGLELNSDIVLGVFVFGTAIGAIFNSMYRSFRIEKIKADLRKQVEDEFATIAARRTRLGTAPVLWESDTGSGDVQTAPVTPTSNLHTIIPIPTKTKNFDIRFSSMTTVVNSDRQWVSVTDAFASFLGYEQAEMIGKLVDDFTVPNSVDIEFVFDALFHLGEMDGLWAFRHCSGESLVVHYRARLSAGLSYADVRPVQSA
jgi:PAS domain-containing protein